MTEPSSSSDDAQFVQQSDFEKIAQMVSAEFQVENALVEHNIPTFYLKQPQETKQAFLRFLKNLEPLNLIALLRKADGRIVLRVLPKPPVKKSNVLVNWLLFFATIATTFVTGYLLFESFNLLSESFINPYVGGATFTVAIMAVLGMHEMSHKLSANKHKVEATPPYFIPGPPAFSGFLGIGTFGAVIMQKSLPPNRDALFDIGSSGPIIGFIIAFIVSLVGLWFSPIFPVKGDEGFLASPLIFELFALFVIRIPQGHYMLLHPVAFAGWVGMVITMLNLLPAAMLDGGHVTRAVFGEKTAGMLTWLSIIYLVLTGFWPMAFFVLFISRSRHPGPLDEVSSLSTKRKALSVFLVVILVLCSMPPQLLL
jgi:membrane-associated protease RseP (regulator of RpoE activity)